MRRLAALVFIFCCIGTVQAQECVIKVGVDELKPHLSPDLDGGGPLAQNFAQAMASMGCDTEFHWIPWARAFQLTKKGKLTMTFPWGDSLQRRKDFVTSKPIWKSKLYVFHLKSTKLTLSSPKDLSKYSIAGVKGYEYFPKNLDADYGIIKVPSEDMLVGMLMKKRLDGILIWDVLVPNHPDLTKNSNITHDEYVLNQKAGVALFSKYDPNAKKYAEIFDAQFSQYLKDSLK